MRALPYTLLLCSLLTGKLVADEQVKSDLIGYTRPVIIAQLGEPMGSLSFDEETILIYPTQRITLINGKATKVEIRPDAIIETPEERDARIAAKRAEIGEQLKEKHKYEPSLLKMSAEEQLRHWGRFKRQFPETDVNPELEKARLRLEQDLQQEHVIVKDRTPIIKPHPSVTDPYYRKRIDFDTPFDTHRHVAVIVPNVLKRQKHKRRAIEQEPYIIDPLPGHQQGDEVFNTPRAVAPILDPPKRANKRQQADNLKPQSKTKQSSKLKKGKKRVHSASSDPK